MRKWNKFLWWVDEVHADYGGIDLLLNGNIKQGLNALEYKKECKDPKDKNIEHPTWEKRIEYVKNISSRPPASRQDTLFPYKCINLVSHIFLHFHQRKTFIFQYYFNLFV